MKKILDPLRENLTQNPYKFVDEKPVQLKKSKTQIKREMIELQKLGERLVKLNPNQIESINIPQDLKDAVLTAKQISKHGARRRQMQRIGVLMREADPEPIREAIERINHNR